MQPAYYENLEEIQNKYWSMLDDAVTNRGSPFRIPVFICAHQDEVDVELLFYVNQIGKIIYCNFTQILDLQRWIFLKKIRMAL